MAHLYFDDLFMDVPDDIDEEGIRENIRGLLNIHVFDIKRIKEFSGRHGKLIEYIVHISSGNQSAKLMITDNPERLLLEFYENESS